MNIHEYQAKTLLRKYGVAVLAGRVAFSAQEAADAASALDGPVWVVKSQIHAGGRGAGRFSNDPDGKGGVRVVKSVDEVRENAQKMLASVLVTKQTGPAGKEVKRLYIEEGCDIARELYLGMLVDRATSRITIMASTEGGMEIEEVAHRTPEKILKVAIDPATGLQPFHTRQIAFGLGLSGKQVSAASKFITALYQAFVDLDEEDPLEVEASKYGLNYIKLDGNVACMVNGAGLAMATMDIIKLYGAEPANFPDVGGGADEAKVTAAFKIIIADPNVKGILVNIFGGIARCDILAQGVVAAVKQVGLKVPLVVRLEGTNAELGKKIINESGLNVIAANDLSDGAEKIVKAVRGAA